jgi:DNA-3-methyladenine glycosylase
MILERPFYARSTEVVAFELIGKILVLSENGAALRGRIVETEAYFGADDPASHAFRGLTPRNRVMFGLPGFSYVYFTYGNHHCLNVVTEPEGVAGAVLIRALEPLEGFSVMEKRRSKASREQWTNGPGKLTQAFGITREHSARDLTQSGSFCAAEDVNEPLLHPVRNGYPISNGVHIQTASRIGISRAKKRPLRFYLMDSPFVSIR